MTIIVKALAKLNRGWLAIWRRSNVARAWCVGVDAAARTKLGFFAVAPCAVSVCGAYLGMLQHAIYKCAPQRCNIKFFSGFVLRLYSGVFGIVVVAVAVAIAIAGGVADYVVGFGGCVNL